MAANSKIRLTIPRQELEEFSLFEPTASAALVWAQSLPVANTRTVADLLGRTIAELMARAAGPAKPGASGFGRRLPPARNKAARRLNI